MSAPGLLHVIYDGQCAFCVRTLRIVGALDRWRVLRFHDAGDAATLGRFPALRDVDLNDAMYVVDDEGAAHEGFFGFRRLAWSSPLTWPMLPIFYAPGAARIGPRIYDWIARHRRHFGCRTDAGVPPPGMRPGCPS